MVQIKGFTLVVDCTRTRCPKPQAQYEMKYNFAGGYNMHPPKMPVIEATLYLLTCIWANNLQSKTRPPTRTNKVRPRVRVYYRPSLQIQVVGHQQLSWQSQSSGHGESDYLGGAHAESSLQQRINAVCQFMHSQVRQMTMSLPGRLVFVGGRVHKLSAQVPDNLTLEIVAGHSCRPALALQS